jgi:uncharacterized membrane protein
MNTFSVGESIRFGWETFKKRPFFFIGTTLIMVVVSMVIGMIVDQIEKGNPGLVAFLATLFEQLVVGVLLAMGVTVLSLKAYTDVQSASIRDLWSPKHYIACLIVYIITVVAVAIGLILLVIPGIIAALILSFPFYLILDKGMKPIDAIKESARITKGHRWQLLLLYITLFAFNLLGLLALVVGLLVTLPISGLAFVYVYRKLEHAASEVTPVPTA